MFDFVTFARDFYINTTNNPKVTSRNWIGTRCPFCVPADTDFHLGFSLEKGNFSCWKCKRHSKWEVVAALTHESRKNVKAIIDKYETDQVYHLDLSEDKVRAKKVELPDKGLTKTERKYIRSRGFSPSYLVNTYKVRGGGLAGRWKYRIILPVLNRKGRILTATGRSIVDSMEPRYLDTPEEYTVTPTRETLFGLHLLPDSDRVIVVEGPLDQIRVGPGSLATFGIGVSPKQVALLSKFKHIFIAFDGEKLAQDSAYKLGHDLYTIGVGDVSIIELSKGKDPDNLNEEELYELRLVLK